LNEISLRLNPDALLTQQSRVLCAINSTITSTALMSTNLFKCSFNVSEDNQFGIGLTFSYPNLFQITNIPGIFEERININIKTSLNFNSIVSLTLNTKSLQDILILKSGCEDLIVTFRNTSINRQITSCGSTLTTIDFVIQQQIVSNSLDYDIYFSNIDYSTNNSLITGIRTAFNYTLEKIPNKLIPLSTNELVYRAVPKVSISQISPQVSYLGNQTVNLFADIAIKNLNLLKYEIDDGTKNYDASLIGNKFTAVIGSMFPQILSLGVYAVYKPTGKKLLISTSNQSLYFWS
jgi:hypothetical protein